MAFTLKFDFVLDNQVLALGINWLGELRRDGVVSSLVLDNETFVAFHALQNHRLLDRPGADILPLLLRRLVRLLFGVRCFPPRVPVICELLEEGCFEVGGLMEANVSGGVRRRAASADVP